MFENIIGYQTLTEHFRNLIEARNFPSVTLLSGGALSGKQTIATEIARALLCEQEGKWQCSCTQCVQSRMLNHQNVLYLGRTSVQQEILCSKHLLEVHKTERERLFFFRAVAKLLRRADSLVWEHSDYWNRTLRSPASTLAELTLSYQEDEQNWYNEKILDKIYTQSIKLYNAFPQQMLPVQCIRNVITWCQVHSHRKSKIIIMNHIEEMLPASANMLLKILEEPPEQVYFLLLSGNAGAVLPTIRSRSREFILSPRSPELENTVLEKIFKYTVEDSAELEASTPITTIHQYLDSYMLLDAHASIDDTTVEHRSIQKRAEQFFQAVLQQSAFTEQLIQLETGETKSTKNNRQNLLLFISYLATCIVQLLDDDAIFAHFIKNMWSKCQQAQEDIKRRNISATLVLELLYYTLSNDYELFITHTRRTR